MNVQVIEEEGISCYIKKKSEYVLVSRKISPDLFNTTYILLQEDDDLGHSFDAARGLPTAGPAGIDPCQTSPVRAALWTPCSLE